MKQLITRLLHFSIGSIGAAVINLILIPVTTYFLTPEEYGKTSMFLLAQTLMIYLIYLGFDQAFTREFYEYKNKKRLLFNAMLVPLMFGILLSALMVGFAPQISSVLFGSSLYTFAIYLLALSIFFLIFERFLLLLIRMNNQAMRFSIYSIIIKSMILIVTLIFLIWLQPIFVTVVYSMIIGQILGDMILIIANWKVFSKDAFHVDKPLLKKLAAFGLPVVVATFIYSLFIIIDKVALRYYTNFSELGLYTAAFKIASALMILQVSFSNFWIPTAYAWFQQKKPIFYYKLVSDIVMLLVSILFIFLLLFKGFIVFILSPQYEAAKFIFPFLCFYPLMLTVSETTNLGIVFQKKSYLNIFVSCLALIIAVCLNLWLVPAYGAIGAAIATGTSFIVYFCARTYFSMRVWEGFSIRNHLVITAVLYALSLYSVFGPDNASQSILALIALLFIFWLYRSLLVKLYTKKAITRFFKKGSN